MQEETQMDVLRICDLKLNIFENNKQKTPPHLTQGGPTAQSIGRLTLKGTATNWVAGELRIVCLAAVFSVMAAASCVSLQQGGERGAWVNIGPGGGGWFRCVEFSPHEDKILIGGDVSGIFESVDGGRSFSVNNNGLLNGYVQSILFHPVDKSIVYLGTRSGIAKSVDGGKSWSTQRNGFSPIDPNLKERAAVYALAFAPDDPERLYAGLGYERGFGREHEANVKLGYFYKTLNGGESWKEVLIDKNVTNESVLSIFPIKENPAKIYLLMESSLYVSNDQGDSWRRVDTLPLTGKACTSLLMKSDDNKTLFVTYTQSNPEGNETGIIKSTDEGTTWQTCYSKKEGKTNYPGGIMRLRAHPRSADILYAVYFRAARGVLRSVDAGATWSDFNVSATKDSDVWCGWSEKATDFAVDPRNASRMIYVNDMEVYLTEDAGVNWSSISSEKSGTDADGRTILWKAQGHGLDILCASSMAIAPHDPKILYVGYWDVQLWKSEDGGKTIRQLKNGLNFRRGAGVGAITIDPERPNTLFVATGGNERHRLFKSLDGGDSFSLVGSQASGLPEEAQILSIVIDEKSPVDNRTVYAALSTRAKDKSAKVGIFKSVDGGMSWVDGSGNLPLERKCVYDIKIDPRNSQVIYVAAGCDPRFSFNPGYVAKSVDGGKNWTVLVDGIRAQKLQIDPFDPDTIYAATIQFTSANGDKPFWVSRDAGTTWTGSGKVAFPLPEQSKWAGTSNEWRACALAVDPSRKGRLYLGFNGSGWMDSDVGQGMFVSDDHGKTWSSFPVMEHGLPRFSGNLQIDPHNPSRMYMLTGGNGMWRLGPAP